MPKSWLCDRGESGSERRTEPQRHIVSSRSQMSISFAFLDFPHQEDLLTFFAQILLTGADRQPTDNLYDSFDEAAGE